MPKVNLFWFRRDLRLHDNAGLFYALTSGLPVVPVFIFDSDILDSLEDRDDPRVNFIHDTLHDLQLELSKMGTTLEVRYGSPAQVIQELISEYEVDTVFANHDYEPYAIERDRKIEKMLSAAGIPFRTYKDQVIFEKNEIAKDNGEPYSVFTPYSRKWKAAIDAEKLKSFNTNKWFHCFYNQPSRHIPSLNEIGFIENKNCIPKPLLNRDLVLHYHETRDIPSVEGTSRLGIHLRFGTISIRQLVSNATELNETFLNELAWREFFMQQLWRHPRLVNECYKKEYENIVWRNSEEEFERWCNGTTGFPLVDAGMRELNATGFMHNRVRMVAASFLVKHLLVDWRLGEAWFARKLLDYELSSNNGNWQWVAGCGCDAAPYFRIFNPYEQAKRFDPKMKYIKRWIPEIGTIKYLDPMVDHAKARERCLNVYKNVISRAHPV